MQRWLVAGYSMSNIAISTTDVAVGDDLQALRKNGACRLRMGSPLRTRGAQAISGYCKSRFVVNVIEDFDERGRFARRVSLAKQLLVVSTMLYAASIPAGRPFPRRIPLPNATRSRNISLNQS